MACSEHSPQSWNGTEKTSLSLRRLGSSERPSAGLDAFELKHGRTEATLLLPLYNLMRSN